MDPVWGYQAINVEAQLADQSSLLHWTRNMIALRKLFQVFGRGTLEFLNPDNRKILAYIRHYDPTSPSREDTPAGGSATYLARHRNRPLRRQPLPLRPARLARSRRLRRHDPRRDARLRPLPAHHRSALSPHPRAVLLLLARATGQLLRTSRHRNDSLSLQRLAFPHRHASHVSAAHPK